MLKFSMREIIVDIFKDKIFPNLDHINSVAIVGGGLLDPEVQALLKIKHLKVDCYGIDKDSIEFDLNHFQQINKAYDLVICSQVLEHLFDAKTALVNLIHMTKPGKFLWIGCPASNRSHGSPNYYSAGYQPDLIIRLIDTYCNSFSIGGVVGSERQYFMTHALRIWPTKEELKNPLINYNFNRRQESVTKKIIRFIYDFPLRAYLYSLPYSPTSQVEYATETWVFSRIDKLKS
jgi:hypothetical protein